MEWNVKKIIYLSALLLIQNGCFDHKGPDLIFTGGQVLTVDENDSVTEAIAIKDGVIIAVGNDETVMALKSPRTEIINLQGKTLIPGFIAAHEHPAMTSIFGGLVDMSGLTHDSSESAWEALTNAVAQAEKGDPVYAKGIDPVLIPDIKIPNRKMLDEIAPNNPVVIISQSMHSYWANSRAFGEAGINKYSLDPSPSSFYEKNEAGELTGFVSETAAAIPLLIPLKRPFRHLKRYEKVLDSFVNNGFTSIVSLGYNAPMWLARYASSKNFQPRVRQFFYHGPADIKNLPDEPDYDDLFCQTRGIKIWYDGSPYTGSMHMHHPYMDTPITRSMQIKPGSRGYAKHSPDSFSQTFAKYANSGWQVAIHSQGDQASDEVQRALTKLNDPTENDRRHRIEHGLLLSKETLSQFQKIGITPSFHINHILYYGDALPKIIGEERTQNILPVKTAFDLNMHPTLHADSPMFPLDAFSLMKTAVMRQTRTKKIVGEQQRITPQQALRAMTINGAWQLHLEKKLGSIEPGKLADLVIISKNIYETPPDDWGSIKVEQVFVEGRKQK